MTTTHLIEEYKVKADTILCCCGWFGKSASFQKHQTTSRPTDKVPTPSPYEMDNFNGPIIQDKGIIFRDVIYNPDMFDYVKPGKKEEIPEIHIDAPLETDEN